MRYDIGYMSNQSLNQNGFFFSLANWINKKSQLTTVRTFSKFLFMRKIKSDVKEKNGYQFMRFLKYFKILNFQMMEFCSKLLSRRSGIILYCSYPKTTWEIKYTRNIGYWRSICIPSTYRIFSSCKWCPHLCQLKYNNSVLNSRVKTEKSDGSECECWKLEMGPCWRELLKGLKCVVLRSGFPVEEQVYSILKEVRSSYKEELSIL